ncbi:hypothetical protein AB4144_27315, partial [Rhizobiaceae sp. 2RAB30]
AFQFIFLLRSDCPLRRGFEPVSLLAPDSVMRSQIVQECDLRSQNLFWTHAGRQLDPERIAAGTSAIEQ